jgi:hypothetical protein
MSRGFGKTRDIMATEPHISRRAIQPKDFFPEPSSSTVHACTELLKTSNEILRVLQASHEVLQANHELLKAWAGSSYPSHPFAGKSHEGITARTGEDYQA